MKKLKNKIKWEFFRDVAVSVLLYSCTIWTLTKYLTKELDEEKAASCLEQIQEVASIKTVVIQPLASHLTNNLSKMEKKTRNVQAVK